MIPPSFAVRIYTKTSLRKFLSKNTLPAGTRMIVKGKARKVIEDGGPDKKLPIRFRLDAAGAIASDEIEAVFAVFNIEDQRLVGISYQNGLANADDLAKAGFTADELASIEKSAFKLDPRKPGSQPFKQPNEKVELPTAAKVEKSGAKPEANVGKKGAKKTNAGVAPESDPADSNHNAEKQSRGDVNTAQNKETTSADSSYLAVAQKLPIEKKAELMDKLLKQLSEISNGQALSANSDTKVKLVFTDNRDLCPIGFDNGKAILKGLRFEATRIEFAVGQTQHAFDLRDFLQKL